MLFAVCYEGVMFCARVDPGDKYGGMLDYLAWSEAKIIGNKFDSPELLKTALK